MMVSFAFEAQEEIFRKPGGGFQCLLVWTAGIQC